MEEAVKRFTLIDFLGFFFARRDIASDGERALVRFCRARPAPVWGELGGAGCELYLPELSVRPCGR